jgi:hypothetical protein
MNVHRNDLAAAATDAVSRAAPVREATLLPLTIAFGDYDRTRPLLDGRVVPAGVAPTYKTEWIGHFCTRPVYEEYDVAEMSMSWYLAARCRSFRCACRCMLTCSAAPTRPTPARGISPASASG